MATVLEDIASAYVLIKKKPETEKRPASIKAYALGIIDGLTGKERTSHDLDELGVALANRVDYHEGRSVGIEYRTNVYLKPS